MTFAMQAIQEIEHVNIKLYARPDSAIELADAIPLFHSWIQQSSLDELLIDVADYTHVAYGPGVMLIGHEANYSLEPGSENRIGLLYNTKVRRSGSNRDRIIFALERAARAASLLEAEEVWQGRLKFSSSDIKLIVNDRHLCPNSEASFAALKADIEAALESFWGDKNFTVHFDRQDPRRLFEVSAALEKPLSV